MKRYSVGVEFLVNAESVDDARSIVGNFVDGFPAEVADEAEGDVIVQDATEDES